QSRAAEPLVDVVAGPAHLTGVGVERALEMVVPAAVGRLPREVAGAEGALGRALDDQIPLKHAAALVTAARPPMARHLNRLKLAVELLRGGGLHCRRGRRQLVGHLDWLNLAVALLGDVDL